MYTIQEHTIIPVQPTDIVTLGNVVDHRIKIIEAIVAEHYGTTVHQLDVYYHDTDAKLMCCFLIHHLLNYSMGSIAKKYRIFPLFLKNKVQDHYKKCLQEPDFMHTVTLLKDAFLESKNLPSVAMGD